MNAKAAKPAKMSRCERVKGIDQAHEDANNTMI